MAGIEHRKDKTKIVTTLVGGPRDGVEVIKERRIKRPKYNRHFTELPNGRRVLTSRYTEEQDITEDFNRKMGIA